MSKLYELDVNSVEKLDCFRGVNVPVQLVWFDFLLWSLSHLRKFAIKSKTRLYKLSSSKTMLYNDNNDQDKKLVVVLLRQHNLLCNLAANCVLKIQIQSTITSVSTKNYCDKNSRILMILMYGVKSHLVKHNYVPVLRLHILHILLLWGIFVMMVHASNDYDDDKGISIYSCYGEFLSWWYTLWWWWWYLHICSCYENLFGHYDTRWWPSGRWLVG